MGNTLSGGTMLKNIGLIIVCNLLMYLIIILIIKIKENVEKMKATAVGQKFTDFEMETPDGKPVKLSDYVGKGKVVLVDFWATWCGPCQTMGPLVEEIAEERADIKVCKLDVDQEPELARQYRVMSIPTFLVFKEGEVVKRDMGVMSKEEVEGLIG